MFSLRTLYFLVHQTNIPSINGLLFLHSLLFLNLLYGYNPFLLLLHQNMLQLCKLNSTFDFSVHWYIKICFIMSPCSSIKRFGLPSLSSFSNFPWDKLFWPFVISAMWLLCFMNNLDDYIRLLSILYASCILPVHLFHKVLLMFSQIYVTLFILAFYLCDIGAS